MTHESKAPAILALNAEGMRSVDIARKLQCSRANVCQCLKLHKRKSITKGGRQPKAQPEAAAKGPIPPEAKLA